jgi:hypothetical protein
MPEITIAPLDDAAVEEIRRARRDRVAEHLPVRHTVVSFELIESGTLRRLLRA